MRRILAAIVSVIVGLFYFVLPVIMPGGGSGVEASYYDGKTVKVLGGWRPGGTANLRAKITVKHLMKYIGENPVFVFQFMPGAGGHRRD